jgi:predicted nucleotidyltransferase
MEIVYTHYEGGYSYTVNRRIYGLRMWKRFIRKCADEHGEYVLYRKGKPWRVAYATRLRDINYRPFLTVVERTL